MLLEFNASPVSSIATTTNLSRKPTFENLAMMATPRRIFSPSSNSSSSGSSSSCCSCGGPVKPDSNNLPKTPTSRPQVRAPLIDIRNFSHSNRTSLGKAVGARFDKSTINSKAPTTKDSSAADQNRAEKPIKISEEKPTKLCSLRLRAARGIFDGFALSILKTGTVVLEKLTASRSAIQEIIQVSADGDVVTTAKLRVQLVAFDSRRPVTIDKLLREGFANVDVKTYRYEAMPSHLYGRYRCAANFVNISRAKTPKVVITKVINGKIVTCQLMESLSDCAVTFESGIGNTNQSCASVTFMPDKMTRIQAGTAVLTLPSDEKDNGRLFQLPKQIYDMLAIANQMRAAAIAIEVSASKIPNFVQFPVECGQRRAVH